MVLKIRFRWAVRTAERLRGWQAMLFYVVIMLFFSSCHREEVYHPDAESRLHYFTPEWPATFGEVAPAFRSVTFSREEVALGKRLFEDSRLSGDGTLSCASCHQQRDAFAHAGFAVSPGVGGMLSTRNAPPLQNLLWQKEFMWDGAVSNLMQQPAIPLTSEEEMHSSLGKVLRVVQQDDQYRKAFALLYPQEEINIPKVFRALQVYLLTLVSATSKYDAVQAGKAQFSKEEAAGYQIFQQKCQQCHSGPQFSDGSYRNIGFPRHSNVQETGRHRVTGREEDSYRYRVPSLRNAGYTAPYGSSGQFATLAAVLDYLSSGVEAAENLDPILKANGNRIPLTELEKKQLLAFMMTLNDKKFVSNVK